MPADLGQCVHCMRLSMCTARQNHVATCGRKADLRLTCVDFEFALLQVVSVSVSWVLMSWHQLVVPQDGSIGCLLQSMQDCFHNDRRLCHVAQSAHMLCTLGLGYCNTSLL